MKFWRKYTHETKAFVAYTFDEYRDVSRDVADNYLKYERVCTISTVDAYYVIVKTPKYKSSHPAYTIPIFKLEAGIETDTKECLDLF